MSEQREGVIRMDLKPIKYHACTQDQGQGILLVDIETETKPLKDVHGNRLYYCMLNHHIFSVGTHQQHATQEGYQETSDMLL